ncbi:MAG: iron-containing alcohol dehydrogenase [Verrucomicrobia bacterium]|nr:iron-containing alcohol dehydrogenase [Verrucomicrobiota bacterium]
MSPVTLLQPGRLVFGSGCALQCAAHLAGLGLKRLLVVTSAPLLGTIAPFVQKLESGGATVTVCSAVNAEPGIRMFEEVLALAESVSPDAVIGIGGGSAMDVAKLVAALVGSPQRIHEVFGINKLAGRDVYLVCLPTTAGTGSEVSPNAILLDERDQLKKGVVSPHLVADAAYVDPLLTVSVPPAVTAATGLDALVHCIEAYANKFAHPLVDIYALEGIRLIGGNLLAAVQDGKNLVARENMALGSLFGGLCLGPVNTAAVHALAYPLGSEFHIAHGVANALLLPHMMRFNLPAALERYANVAVALGAARNGSPATTAEEGLRRVAELTRQCGVPLHMAELGVPAAAIPRMAKAAMTVERLLKNNPRPVTEADAVKIYEAAL